MMMHVPATGRMCSHLHMPCSLSSSPGAMYQQTAVGSTDSFRQRVLQPRCSLRHKRRMLQHLQAVSDTAAAAELSAVEQAADAPTQQIRLQVQVITSLDKVSADEWDRCATGSGETNPFTLHCFLHTLERAACAVKEEGWLPQHVLVREEGSGELLGAVPLYLKSHSYGEYVFDHSWASSCHRLGQPYYPKLQSCVPFTPATGARILLAPSPAAPAVRRALAQTLMTITDELGVSSLHMTFNQEAEAGEMARLGYLHRTGIQYHWENQGYSSFEDFLAALKQSKRKNVRQERKAVAAAGLRLRRLTGDDLTPQVWDRFYEFYQNTTSNKWGQQYLTREFFHQLGERMPERVLLAVAEQDGELVAGALNFVGSHALFGRNWGCAYGLRIKHLHFELCYYQALEAAIEAGLPRVEAGAQGEHKIQRGYLPSLTHSSHYIRDPDFRGAVAHFLRRERANIDYTLDALTAEASPYKSAA